MELPRITPLKPELLETTESPTLTPPTPDLSMLELKKADSSPETFLQIVQKTVAKSKPRKNKEEEPQEDMYNFEVHGKQLRFGKNSLFLFSDKNRLRKFVVWIVESKYFDITISLIILLNTIFLALMDYEVRVIPDKQSTLNDLVNTADNLFSYIFIAEFVLKVFAMGFIIGKGTYLRDGWNVIDFVVVITSITYNIPEIPNLSALRSIRAIKPLRSINTVKGMKALVGSLIISLPALANVAIFLSFLIVIYGILGVQLFSGAFESRCRMTPQPVDGLWPADPTVLSLCGTFTCPIGTYCGNPSDYGLEKNWAEVQIPEFQYGIPNFDNMLNATLTVFQSLTTEGWSNNMFLFSQAYSPVIVYTYFCSLIIFGAFFAVNLILAVISDAFNTSNAKERGDQNNKSFSTFQSKQYSTQKYSSFKIANDLDESQTMSKFSSSKVVPIKSDEKTTDDILILLEDTPLQSSTSTNSQSPKLPILRLQKNKKSGFSTDRTGIDKATTEKSIMDKTPKSRVTQEDVVTGIATFLVDEHMNERTQNNRLYYYTHKFIMSSVFQNTIVLLILLNTVILALAKYPDDSDMNQVLETINMALIFVFTAEMLIKLVGLGFREYFKDRFNLFDSVLVIVSLAEFALDNIFGANSGLTVVTAFRSFRLVRVFKLARSWENLRNLLKVFGNTMKDIKNFSILLILFMIIASLLGRELFAYQAKQADGTYPRLNFNTFFDALITVFALLTNEDWNNIMYNHLLTNGGASAFYFVAIVIIGNYILLKLFLAILINNFQDLRISGTANWGNVFSMLKARKKKLTEKFSRARQIFRRNTRMKISPIVIPNDDIGQKSNSPRSNTSEIRIPTKTDSPRNFAQLAHQMSFDVSSADDGPSTPRKRVEIFKKKPERPPLEGYSFWVLGPNNLFRRFMRALVMNSAFENFIIVAILCSSVILALDSPLDDPSTTYSNVILILDRVTTGIFAFEMVSKMIVNGVLLNGPQSHLKNAWSLLDSLIVVISIITLVSDLAGGSQNIQLLKQLKILRVLRVLRPLRLISRNEGLKLVLNSILAAIPSLLNLIVVCLLFFLLFGVVGVNFFKGQFYYCDLTNISQALQSNIVTKQDCMDYGGDWVNQDANFDNVLQATLTLFILSTTEGWISIMYYGVDSAGIDLQPVTDNRKIWSIFFVAFIIVGAFFILNLFAGVVVDTFNREKDRLDGISFLTKEQQAWVKMKLNMVKVKPYREPDLPQNIISKGLRKLTDNRKFEIFTLSLILVNMLIFALHWQRQSDDLENAFDWMNYILLGVFVFEAIIKIIGHGKSYFRDGWNIFDFSVIIASIASLVIDKVISLESVSLGSSASIIRTFRIGRLFRLINKAKSLRTIFNTIIITLPALANIGGLLFLVLFIYASLGNSLFAYQRIDEYITEDTNFQTFGNSFLTLFKASTGEGWNYLLYACSRTLTPNYACHDVETYDDYMAYGLNDCGTGATAVLYFVSFQLIFTLILLNLFIAIILEAFNESKKSENAIVLENDFESFREKFKKYDPKGRGLIRETDIDLLLKDIHAPVGDPLWKISSKERTKFIIQADLPVYKHSKGNTRYYQFHDILLSLCKRVAQKTDNATVFEFEELPGSENIHQLKQFEKIKLKYIQSVPHLILYQLTGAQLRAASVLTKWVKDTKERKIAKELRKNRRNNLLAKPQVQKTEQKKDVFTLGKILDEIETPEITRREAEPTKITKAEATKNTKTEPAKIIKMEAPLQVEPKKARDLSKRKTMKPAQLQDIEIDEADAREETFPLNSPTTKRETNNKEKAQKTVANSPTKKETKSKKKGGLKSLKSLDWIVLP